MSPAAAQLLLLRMSCNKLDSLSQAMEDAPVNQGVSGATAGAGASMRMVLCCAALLAAGPALAELPDVPGGDIFGFTDATDTGSPGDKGVSFEWTGSFGKRDGHYRAQALKTEFGVTPMENLFAAFSFFTTRHNIAGSSEFADINKTAFDGVSGEAMYRILPRNAGFPFAISVAIEPRYASVDGTAGTPVHQYSVEGKLFVDTVIVPDRLYGAFNANFAWARQRDRLPDAEWAEASGGLLSGSLSYQLSPQFFIGAEVRYLSAFRGGWFNDFAGDALFFGPHIFFQITDKAALNVAWSPQIWGTSDLTPGSSIDLDYFERHQFRAKFSMAF